MIGAIRIGNATLDDRAGGNRHDGGALGAGHQNVVRKAVGLLIVRVAHDEAVALVPQHEGFRRALDRVGEPLVGFLVALGEAVLEADHTQVMVYRGRDGAVWVRPRVAFFEHVEVDGAALPRFAPVDAPPDWPSTTPSA